VCVCVCDSLSEFVCDSLSEFGLLWVGVGVGGRGEAVCVCVWARGGS
jgi:hypothetical protein